MRQSSSLGYVEMMFLYIFHLLVLALTDEATRCNPNPFLYDNTSGIWKQLLAPFVSSLFQFEYSQVFVVFHHVTGLCEPFSLLWTTPVVNISC